MSGTWPSTPQAVRRLRWRVLIGGVPLLGCEHVEIHQTNHRKPSTLSAKFALGADASMVTQWFDAAPPIMIEVQAGFLPDGKPESAVPWQSAFTGEVSDVDPDPVSGTVSCTGRDLMGRLIDARIRENYANKKSSEIAQILAAQYGLTADVDETSALAGTYYQLEHDAVSLDGFGKNQSPNDLLLFLAKNEGYDYWCDGTTLHFKEAVDPDTATPLRLAYKPRGPLAYPVIPVTSISGRRSLILNKGIKVTVKCWQARAKSSHAISYPPGASASAQEYVYIRQGWSPARALAYAQSQYEDIVRHERTVEIDMPGELDLTPRSIVALSGFPGTSFNTTYFVDELSRTFTKDGGYQQHVALKNHSVQSDSTV